MHKIKNIIRVICYRFIYNIVYKFFCIFNKIDSKKIIIDNKDNVKIDNSFSFLIYYLKTKTNYKTYIFNKNKSLKNDIELIKQLASTKYVFLSTFHNVIDCLNLRKQTKIINLWHGCGIFKKFGYACADSSWGQGDLVKRFKTFRLYQNTDLFTVSSDFCIPYYCEAVNKDENIVKSLGISRTDSFFDEKFKTTALEHLQSLLNFDFSDKKIILYAPTFRGNELKNAVIPSFIEIEKLAQNFSNEYILLIKHHPEAKDKQIIPDSCKNFAFDLSGLIDINELLVLSEILISDYSSLIFEFSLMEKPMIFFGPDIDQYNTERGFFQNYFDMIPGPLCRSNSELINCLNTISSFDINKIKKFKEIYMSACDGHSTEKILNYIESL